MRLLFLQLVEQNHVLVAHVGVGHDRGLSLTGGAYHVQIGVLQVLDLVATLLFLRACSGGGPLLLLLFLARHH